jgi:hypothetical protein
MNEHESNLHDLYVGLAMMALVIRKDKNFEGIDCAFDIADNLLAERTNRRKEKEGGIADILTKWGDES